MAHRAWNACRCVAVSVRDNLEGRQWDRHWPVTVHRLRTSPVMGACTAHERRARDMSHATYAEADLCPKPEEAEMGHRERKQTTIYTEG
jgi:hypothetical protein